MNLKTEAQFRQELAGLWKVIDMQRDYIAQQTALLRRAGKVVEDKASEAYELDCTFCLECNEEWGYGHKEGCGVGKAQALAPTIRAELVQKQRLLPKS